MPKPFSEKNSSDTYYLTHSREDKGVHTFPKGICPKVNIIVRLEYELAYNDSAVHRFNHYTTRTPPFQRGVCLTVHSAVYPLLVYHIYPTPPLGQDMTQGQFSKRSLTGLNSEFSFS